MDLRWTFLLVLMLLLAVTEQEEPDLHVSGEPSETDGCQQPQWDSRLHFTPNQNFYGLNEEVTLSCFVEDSPPLAVIRCAKGMTPGWKNAWEVKDNKDMWHEVAENLTCTTGKCPAPQWDERLRFSPNRRNYRQNEELNLTCLGALKPSLPKVKCAKQFLTVKYEEPVYGETWWGRNSTGAWIPVERALKCIEMCQRPQWDTRLELTPDQENYKKNEEVMLRCPEGLQLSFTKIKCSVVVQHNSNGKAVYKEIWYALDMHGRISIQSNVECLETCQKPQWDTKLELSPSQWNYKKNEEVMLRCTAGFQPSFTKIKCSGEDQHNSSEKPVYRGVWLGMESRGGWIPIQSGVECLETCQRPQWDARLRLVPDQENYKKNDQVTLSCPQGFQPSVTRIKCSSNVRPISSWNPSHRGDWSVWNSRGVWIHVASSVKCIEMCQRPRWGARLQLVPDQENYEKNKQVMLSCPEGFQTPFTHVTCRGAVQFISNRPPVYTDQWFGWDSRGTWTHIQYSVQCIDILKVFPGTLEISSTSIKLNWTCSVPDVCQRMQARCRLAGPLSSPCEAEEVKREETLQGQEGTFTCPSLQPFTDYSVTISLPPNMILYKRLFRTKETVPDKLEKLWLDPSTGFLRWKPLPSCKGEIIGYQLNITTRSTQDGSLLEMERLWLNSPVTEYRLPEHSPGSRYVVMIQGLTAAGAGAASLWELQTNSSDTPHPLDISCHSIRDISPSQGTAVLPLHPITRPSEAVREHQLIVAVMDNVMSVEDACSWEPQPFNASQQPGAYVAAVLNLTAPTEFVLGNGTHGQGHHNAALHPGWDYMVLLRLVRRSQQAEKFSCICYSFSVVAGQHPGPWHGTVVGVVVLLVLLLISAGILWFVLSRKRKSLPRKAKEDH